MDQASTDNKALLHAETLFLKNVSLACKLQKKKAVSEKIQKHIFTSWKKNLLQSANVVCECK